MLAGGPLFCNTGGSPQGGNPSAAWLFIRTNLNPLAASDAWCICQIRTSCPGGLRYSKLKKLLQVFDGGGGASYERLGKMLLLRPYYLLCCNMLWFLPPTSRPEPVEKLCFCWVTLRLPAKLPPYCWLKVHMPRLQQFITCKPFPHAVGKQAYCRNSHALDQHS